MVVRIGDSIGVGCVNGLDVRFPGIGEKEREGADQMTGKGTEHGPKACLFLRGQHEAFQIPKPDHS
jgi:hypothetical protein